MAASQRCETETASIWKKRIDDEWDKSSVVLYLVDFMNEKLLTQLDVGTMILIHCGAGQRRHADKLSHRPWQICGIQEEVLKERADRSSKYLEDDHLPRSITVSIMCHGSRYCRAGTSLRMTAQNFGWSMVMRASTAASTLVNNARPRSGPEEIPRLYATRFLQQQQKYMRSYGSGIKTSQLWSFLYSNWVLKSWNDEEKIVAYFYTES